MGVLPWVWWYGFRRHTAYPLGSLAESLTNTAFGFIRAYVLLALWHARPALGGYAAGYYGYMWAEVIALDMLSAFGDRLINPEVGARFRRDILSRGSEEPASVLVERFLGRPVNADAFFKEIVGART